MNGSRPIPIVAPPIAEGAGGGRGSIIGGGSGKGEDRSKEKREARSKGKRKSKKIAAKGDQKETRISEDVAQLAALGAVAAFAAVASVIFFVDKHDQQIVFCFCFFSFVS